MAGIYTPSPRAGNQALRIIRLAVLGLAGVGVGFACLPTPVASQQPAEPVQQPPEAARQPPEASRQLPEAARHTSEGPSASLALRFEARALVDLVMLVRAAAENGEGEGPAILQPAVDASRALGRAMEGPLAWMPLMVPLAMAETVGELRRAYESLPAISPVSHGGPSGHLAATFLDALEEVEEAFLRELWPERRGLLEAEAGRLDAALGEAGRDWSSFVREHLRVTSGQDTVRVLLSTEAPWPGGVTFRTRAGGVCFVGLSAASGNQRLELVIHEAIHALDVSTRGEETALQLLRERLAAAGVSPADATFRDLTHLIVFLHGGETVRRVLDPTHVHYGDTEGVYGRMGELVPVVRPVWDRYLDGELELEGALDRIVREAVAITR